VGGEGTKTRSTGEREVEKKKEGEKKTKKTTGSEINEISQHK
jgi:hypothetical protein